MINYPYLKLNKLRGLKLTSLTASRLIASDSVKTLESTDLASWVTDTNNQIIIVDNGDGTVTLSLPQNIHTEASPTFAGLTSTGTIDASAGKVLVEDKATSKPASESDGYVGVAKISNDGRMYFFVEGLRYYVIGIPAPPSGSSMGLLLALTYA